jgi:drug/metabolite transporter (DMT)-like permease
MEVVNEMGAGGRDLGQFGARGRASVRWHEGPRRNPGFSAPGSRRAFGPPDTNRNILAAVASLAVSFFAFLALISVSELSFAVPATAATYVLETILAKYLLRELVDWRRWAGATLVAGGVALLML